MHHDPRRRRVVALAGLAPFAPFAASSAFAADDKTGGDRSTADDPLAAQRALPTGPTLALARFATSLNAGELPAQLRSTFSLYLLDCVSTMLAGCVQPVHRRVQTALAQVEGSGTVEAIGAGTGSLATAVLLDALAAADFEFEHVMASTHPSSTAFPALLTLAAERDLSGAELLSATVAAYEVAARIGMASGPEVEEERGLHNPGLNGTLGAAAGCARLLGADADTCASALGLAASSSAGLMSYLDAGAMTKRLHPARCAQLGMESVLMAMAGVEGPRNVLESERGFLHAFAPKPRPALLTQGLGVEWRSLQMIAKLSPGHARAQAWIEAINAARDRGEIGPSSTIVSVVAEGPAALLSPRQWDARPPTLVSAQYSIAYCIAVALARDLRDPMQMNDSAVTDAEVRRIAASTLARRLVDGQSSPTLTLVGADRSLKLAIGAYPGAPGAPGFGPGVESKFARTLAGLHIERHMAPLREAVERIGDRHGPQSLRRAMVAAGRDAARALPVA